MAEESDLEKTEPATPRRLEKAREEGDVPTIKGIGNMHDSARCRYGFVGAG